MSRECLVDGRRIPLSQVLKAEEQGVHPLEIEETSVEGEKGIDVEPALLIDEGALSLDKELDAEDALEQVKLPVEEPAPVPVKKKAGRPAGKKSGASAL